MDHLARQMRATMTIATVKARGSPPKGPNATDGFGEAETRRAARPKAEREGFDEV
jgi:hypothetical protein